MINCWGDLCTTTVRDIQRRDAFISFFLLQPSNTSSFSFLEHSGPDITAIKTISKTFTNFEWFRRSFYVLRKDRMSSLEVFIRVEHPGKTLQADWILGLRWTLLLMYLCCNNSQKDWSHIKLDAEQTQRGGCKHFIIKHIIRGLVIN